MSATVNDLTNEWWEQMREIRRKFESDNTDATTLEKMKQDVSYIAEDARLLQNSMGDLKDDSLGLFCEIDDQIAYLVKLEELEAKARKANTDLDAAILWTETEGDSEESWNHVSHCRTVAIKATAERDAHVATGGKNAETD